MFQRRMRPSRFHPSCRRPRASRRRKPPVPCPAFPGRAIRRMTEILRRQARRLHFSAWSPRWIPRWSPCRCLRGPAAPVPRLVPGPVTAWREFPARLPCARRIHGTTVRPRAPESREGIAAWGSRIHRRKPAPTPRLWMRPPRGLLRNPTRTSRGRRPCRWYPRQPSNPAARWLRAEGACRLLPHPARWPARPGARRGFPAPPPGCPGIGGVPAESRPARVRRPQV